MTINICKTIYECATLIYIEDILNLISATGVKLKFKIKDDKFDFIVNLTTFKI